jgi:hypothetical protein
MTTNSQARGGIIAAMSCNAQEGRQYLAISFATAMIYRPQYVLQYISKLNNS